MSSIFEFSISKSGYMELFIKISGKKVFLEFLLAKDILRQRCRKGSWFSKDFLTFFQVFWDSVSTLYDPQISDDFYFIVSFPGT